jgi:inositol phosphorylceramide mannosyltransferase catalytic subunit
MAYPGAMRFLFLNQPTARQYIPVQAEGSAIPRIIHQTHSSQDALPCAILESICALRESNPDWEYRFYDDNAVVRFIREAYGANVLTYFNRIDPRYGAARADLFRYLLLYRVGGVYLDIKSTARRPLDETIAPTDRLILTQWPQDDRFEGAGRHDWEFAGKIESGEFQQWHVMSPPGHPYIYAVIQAVMRNIDCYIPRMHGSGRNAVLRLTGPIAYTLAILPLLPLNRHLLVTDHEALGLDYSVYPGNADHKRLFHTHYTELTAPIVRPSPFRFCLSALYGVFDRLRGRRPTT